MGRNDWGPWNGAAYQVVVSETNYRVPMDLRSPETTYGQGRVVGVSPKANI